MMIGSFFALMFYILAPVDLGLKKIFLHTDDCYCLCHDCALRFLLHPGSERLRNRYIRCDDDVEIQQKQASLCWP